ncbi:MAG: hypothetical protein K6E18_08025 [Lachnospiraceae bacterium]|nr:hypothetical protein [Lachnospiraceae bacterium]
MNRITKWIGKLVIVLCAVGMLCGCGAPTQDPIAEDYLVKMLDGIEKKDSDTIASLFWKEAVSLDELMRIEGNLDNKRAVQIV